MPANWPVVKSYFAIVIILSIVGWTGIARVVRGRFLSMREEDFVMAAELDGASLRPLLEDPHADWERPALTTYTRGNHAVRADRWRYIRYADGTEELYDHSDDPHEWHNLAGDDAYAIDHDGNGLDDFLVLNGRGSGKGPLQLIAFYR